MTESIALVFPSHFLLFSLHLLVGFFFFKFCNLQIDDIFYLSPYNYYSFSLFFFYIFLLMFFFSLRIFLFSFSFIIINVCIKIVKNTFLVLFKFVLFLVVKKISPGYKSNSSNQIYILFYFFYFIDFLINFYANVN